MEEVVAFDVVVVVEVVAVVIDQVPVAAKMEEALMAVKEILVGEEVTGSFSSAEALKFVKYKKQHQECNILFKNKQSRPQCGPPSASMIASTGFYQSKSTL